MMDPPAAILAGAGAACAATATLAAGAFLPNSRIFGPVVGRGPSDRPNVYLTFDDGPNPGATAAALEALDRAGAPAAFFMVGRYARARPDLARAVAAAGHLVGSHTFSHRKLTFLGPETVRTEITTGHAAVEEATGARPAAFRAPHGHRNPFVHKTLRALHCPLVGWTLGVWDSDRPGVETIRRRVRHGVRAGTIVLLHDGDGYDEGGDRSQTARALPGILTDLSDAGYAIRPLAELLGSPATPPLSA
jgi:peptidoglycan-N-acetylglucosamine deacetylase